MSVRVAIWSLRGEGGGGGTCRISKLYGAIVTNIRPNDLIYECMSYTLNFVSTYNLTVVTVTAAIMDFKLLLNA